MVGTHKTALHFDLFGLTVLLPVFLGLVLVVLLLGLGGHGQDSHETVFVGEEKLGEVVVIESVHHLLSPILVTVKLKWFYQGVFIEQLRVVLDQPFSPAIAVEHNQMFLSQ